MAAANEWETPASHPRRLTREFHTTTNLHQRPIWEGDEKYTGALHASPTHPACSSSSSSSGTHSPCLQQQVRNPGRRQQQLRNPWHQHHTHLSLTLPAAAAPEPRAPAAAAAVRCTSRVWRAPGAEGAALPHLSGAVDLDLVGAATQTLLELPWLLRRG